MVKVLWESSGAFRRDIRDQGAWKEAAWVNFSYCIEESDSKKQRGITSKARATHYSNESHSSHALYPALLLPPSNLATQPSCSHFSTLEMHNTSSFCPLYVSDLDLLHIPTFSMSYNGITLLHSTNNTERNTSKRSSSDPDSGELSRTLWLHTLNSSKHLHKSVDCSNEHQNRGTSNNSLDP